MKTETADVKLTDRTGHVTYLTVRGTAQGIERVARERAAERGCRYDVIYTPKFFADTYANRGGRGVDQSLFR